MKSSSRCRLHSSFQGVEHRPGASSLFPSLKSDSPFSSVLGERFDRLFETRDLIPGVLLAASRARAGSLEGVIRLRRDVRFYSNPLQFVFVTGLIARPVGTKIASVSFTAYMPPGFAPPPVVSPMSVARLRVLKL